MLKVTKFGGSSLADANQFRKVKNIILSDKNRKYLVPSAMGKRSYTDEKITDMLYACHAHAAEGKPFNDIFDRIIERHMDAAFELELKIDMLSFLNKIRADIAGGETADYAASRGEYLTGLMMADYLGWRFLDPKEVIFFTEAGMLDERRTNNALSKRLSDGIPTVVPGFYGSAPDGKIKTFSRGGSDITGAIVARGVNADLYENWTDVPGFLMADPRIVNNPKVICELTYRELRELAYMGATVLHEDSIFPVRQASIPINVRNTNEPEAPGTMIVSENTCSNSPGSITGIAGKTGFTVIAIEKDNMNSEIGFGRKVLETLDKLKISFEHMPSGIDTLSLVIADSQIKDKRKQLIDEIINACNPDSVEIHDNMAIIATVGSGMINSIGTAAKLFNALSEAKVNIRMIDQGSSEINIIVGVESDDFNDAVRAIYKAFA
jgi:aspartate kinase